jgi:AcrR family transcriptional regulator
MEENLWKEVETRCPFVSGTVAKKWKCSVHFCNLCHMGVPDPTIERPLRCDAERNRERILTAAREAFAEDGLDVGLHEIARRAGVGVGTVYRRFADKDVLIDALFEDRIGDVVAIAEDALAQEDAWQGLEHFLTRTLELQAADRGLHQLVFARDQGPRCAAGARRRIAPLAMRLVARAQEQGTLREDITAFDVGTARQMLGLVVEQTRDINADAWRRQLAITLDGLRRRREAPTPLPGMSLTLAELDRVGIS